MKTSEINLRWRKADISLPGTGWGKFPHRVEMEPILEYHTGKEWLPVETQYDWALKVKQK